MSFIAKSLALFNRMVYIPLIVVIYHISLQEIGWSSALVTSSFRSTRRMMIRYTLVNPFKEFIALLLLENHTFWNSSNRLVVWISQTILHILANLFLTTRLNMRGVVGWVIGILHVLILVMLTHVGFTTDIYWLRFFSIFRFCDVLIRRENNIWIRLFWAVSKTSWWQGLPII